MLIENKVLCWAFFFVCFFCLAHSDAVHISQAVLVSLGRGIAKHQSSNVPAM